MRHLIGKLGDEEVVVLPETEQSENLGEALAPYSDHDVLLVPPPNPVAAFFLGFSVIPKHLKGNWCNFYVLTSRILTE